MLDVPPVIGHRGAAGHAPENTLASFAKAAELGCRMIEFDVRLSADHIPVVFHDDYLDRCTRGSGPVRAASLAQLKTLSVGGQPIPTLDEVLALCLERGLGVNMEIKPDRGAEHLTTRLAVELAGAIWPSDRAPPLVSSFRTEALETAAEIAPHWPRGLLVGRLPRHWQGLVMRLGCSTVNMDHRWLSAAQAAEISSLGMGVLAYTVNDAARALTMLRRGVLAVFSDFPDRLLPTIYEMS